jgi:hypothetical protein
MQFHQTTESLGRATVHFALSNDGTLYIILDRPGVLYILRCHPVPYNS